MNTNEQIAVMTAYAEGKMIQMRRHNSDKWEDVLIENVLWNWCDRDYRVKPEEVTLPKTWEEFCENNPIKEGETYLSSFGYIVENKNLLFRKEKDIGVLPNQELAKAMLALCQLIQLRDCYNGEWKPDWKDNSFKYVIYTYYDEIIDDRNVSNNAILTFKTEELRDEFLNNFRKLIEKAKPLL